MKQQQTLSKSILVVALVTILILMVPLIAMQFTKEVNWSVGDFVVMGALMFGTGMLIMLALRSGANIVYRGGVLVVIGTTFLMIWANLAVGLIGSGPNLANLLYVAVVAVLLAGIYLSRFKPAGMERAMFATAGALVLHSLIALLMGMQDSPGSSVIEIIGVNLFFATPYVAAGLLFRFDSLQQSQRAEG